MSKLLCRNLMAFFTLSQFYVLTLLNYYRKHNLIAVYLRNTINYRSVYPGGTQYTVGSH